MPNYYYYYFLGFTLSIHIGGGINLAIWFHKKLLYLSYILTLQNTQYQWFYFNFQRNKII